MDVLHLFASIRVGSSGGADALHKPLLLLLALSRCKKRELRLATFSFYDKGLCNLFEGFYREGLLTKNTHYPFGKLENDALWEIEGSAQLKRTSVGHLHKSELIAKNVRAGFVEPIYSALCNDCCLLNQVVTLLLDRFFQPVQHFQLRQILGFVDKPQDVPEKSAGKDGHEIPIGEFQEKPSTQRKAKRSDAMKENPFIAYLNSLHNVGAAGANALAESQALNRYFAELYEPFPIIDDILKALREQRDCVVILTGHAGDGKSTVALDIFKKLKGLPESDPLPKALEEREYIENALGGSGAVTLVKDMSELGADRRLQWIEDAFQQSGSWLIVSNTGPLLNSLSEFAERAQVIGDFESKMLQQLNRPYIEGRIDEHRLEEFPKDLVIINMTRLDNVTRGARVLKRIVEHSAWADCHGCMIRDACPLVLNHQALAATSGVAEERVRWIYRRLTAYEQRLTLRQMVAHLAYSLTGGMSCQAAQQSVNASTAQGADRGTDGLESIIFSEAFFGYSKGEPAQKASALRAVELVRREVFGGPIGADFARHLGQGQGNTWSILPTALAPLSKRWSARAREAAGVRWRFAQRRMFYLFGRVATGNEEQSEIFLDEFVQSPRLRDFDRWSLDLALSLSRIEQKRLRNACLRVLLETYSGFSAGQFRSDQNRLYLTLRRPDRAVVQPTQLVMATFYFDDFDIRYDTAQRLPQLVYTRGDVRLALTLPLLDYIERRQRGDLGGDLAAIHLAQLEWFRAELSRVSSMQQAQSELALLRANIDGQVHVHRYMMDANCERLEIDK